MQETKVVKLLGLTFDRLIPHSKRSGVLAFRHSCVGTIEDNDGDFGNLSFSRRQQSVRSTQHDSRTSLDKH